MTLATIFFISLFLAASGLPQELSVGQSAPQSETAKPADTSPAQAQDTSPASTPPKTSSPAKTPASSGRSTSTKHPQHKKKAAPSDCVPAPAATTTAGAPNSDPSASKPTTAPGAAQTATAPTNCPPSKIIVRQGGTSDPSIQLAGGAAGVQADQQRNTANQMLAATEQNLKKIVGQSLSQDQQTMVTQIRQFMDQSKTAVTAGDTERARTLAWKAQLLSEELVSPAK